jgi:hypothetical protein
MNSVEKKVTGKTKIGPLFQGVVLHAAGHLATPIYSVAFQLECDLDIRRHWKTSQSFS